MARDVKSLYDLCANITRQVEADVAAGKTPDSAMLNSLSAAYQEIIQFAKCYLIQCQDRFWGSVLMGMDIDIDMRQRGPIDVKINTSPFTITINPLFCSNYKFPEFIGLIVNELTKLVWLHPAVYQATNPEKDPTKHKILEDASSIASTNVIRRDVRLNPNDRSNNGCRIPNDVLTFNKTNTERGIKMLDEQPMEYYYKILKHFKDPTQEGAPNSGNTPNGNAPNSSTDPNGIATRNNSSGQETHNWEGGDSEETTTQITTMVSQALDSLTETQRGYMPASVLSQIKALLAPPEINWKQVLRKMVGSVPVPYRKTRTRLNRRQPFRADLSGKLPKRTVNIVCCFDTSGSMSDADLKYCVNEVFNIVKIYEGFKVTIIECDATVNKVYEARKISDVQTKMLGRGGTSFIPAIKFINGEGEYKNAKKYPLAGKFKNALMIYFTDGYGDSEIPKPKTYRNLWVVLKDVKNLSLSNPYGDVKSLSMDKDWKKFKNAQ